MLLPHNPYYVVDKYGGKMKKEIIAAVISGIIGLVGGYSIHNEQKFDCPN